jgi:glycosyltransferase involved in cell wall biosynthesis
MSKSTLSCCYVVKNEESQIIDSLNCITTLADEIVIVDTGSNDGTLSVINNWVNKLGIQNAVKVLSVGDMFHDSDGDFDFGGAKTYAFNNATKDFVMWLDATDRVTDQINIKKAFLDITNKDKNVYFSLPTELTKKFAYIRVRIGPRNTSSMVGRIHEYMAFTNYKELTKHFVSIPIENHKENRNLGRNIRQLIKEWELRKSPRICFYIGLTYRELKDTNNALAWFRRRIYNHEFKEGFDEEYYKALESICELLIDSKYDSIYDTELFDTATEMIKCNPKRFEGYYYMGQYHIKKEEYEKAIEYFRKYKTCSRPDKYQLWLNPVIYSGKAIVNAVEQCKTSIQYKDVLIPTEITELNPIQSTFTSGEDQYY